MVVTLSTILSQKILTSVSTTYSPPFLSLTTIVFSKSFRVIVPIQIIVTGKGSTNSEWDIMEVYKRVYTDVEEKRKEFPHTAPCGLRYLKDPKYLQSIWSRNAPEPIDDIVQDETIKELDEFGSKEVTFY